MQRGQRLDERVQGAGLGLSICQDIVENYAGSLLLENQDHGGIVVTIRLPIV
jgi:K+-sensing histidine kinase KdpD